MLLFSASQRTPPVLNLASSAQNLKKQGILPLLFKNKDDYEVIDPADKVGAKSVQTEGRTDLTHHINSFNCETLTSFVRARL